MDIQRKALTALLSHEVKLEVCPKCRSGLVDYRINDEIDTEDVTRSFVYVCVQCKHEWRHNNDNQS